MNDIEVKTHVSEKVHDDLLLASRAYGFSTKAEFIRFLIERELYGALSHIQISAPRPRSEGPDKGGKRA